MLTGLPELDALIHSFNRFPKGTKLMGYDHNMKHEMGTEVYLLASTDKHGSACGVSPEYYSYKDCTVEYQVDQNEVQFDKRGLPFLEVYIFAEKTWQEIWGYSDECIRDCSNYWEGDVKLYTLQDFHSQNL